MDRKYNLLILQKVSLLQENVLYFLYLSNKGSRHGLWHLTKPTILVIYIPRLTNIYVTVNWIMVHDFSKDWQLHDLHRFLDVHFFICLFLMDLHNGFSNIGLCGYCN